MRWIRWIHIIVVVLLILAGCSKGAGQPVESVQPAEPSGEGANEQGPSEPAETEPAKEEQQETKSDFPVPIYQAGKRIDLSDLPEASQLAVQWAYDFFNTEGIQTEEEFYEMMKKKYYAHFPIPPDIDQPKMLFADYGSDMLPAFNTGQKVTSIIVEPEVQIGLAINIPLYIGFEGKDNVHGVVLGYDPSAKIILGADKNFPMPGEVDKPS